MDRRLMLMENFSPGGGGGGVPLKPLGQSEPNFIWSILGKGERKFI